MDVKKLVDVLRANRVSFNSGFSYVENEGCIEAYEPIYKTVLEEIDKLVGFGLNNGFSSCDETIERLTTIIVNICKEGNTKKLRKIDSEVQSICSENAKIMKKGTKISVIPDVEKRINSCISATKVLLKLDIANDRKVILEESIEKFEDLKSIINAIKVVSTTEALDFSKSIINRINSWAKEVTSNMHNIKTPAYIDLAIDSAMSWLKLTTGLEQKAFGRSNRIKEENLKDIAYLEDKDDMWIVSKSEDVLINIKIFNSNLDEFKRSQFASYDVTEEEAKVKELKSDIEENNKRIREYVSLVKNGDMVKDDAIDLIADLKDEIAEIENRINKYKKEIRYKKENKRIMDHSLRALENLQATLKKYEKQPVLLGLLGAKIDYAIITKIMQGVGDANDIRYLSNLVAYLEEMAKEIIKRWETTQDEIHQVVHEIRDESKDKAMDKKRESLKKDIDAEFFSDDSIVDADPNKKKSEVKKPSIIDDDDLF